MIKSIAKTFKNDYKITSNVDLTQLEEIASINGWIVRPYSQAVKLIIDLELTKYADKYVAFTYIGKNGDIIILYSDDLSPQNLNRCICHEFGHLVLKHDMLDNGLINQKGRLENEANEFARVLLNDHKDIFIPIIALVMLLIIGSITVYQNRLYTNQTAHSIVTYTPNYTNVTETTIIIDSHIVYITKTGNKYHRVDCRHIQGHDTIKISINQVQEMYEPCKDCQLDKQ